MSAHALVAHVRARLGRLSPSLPKEKEGDVEIFLDEVSAEVDAALQTHGASLPLPDDVEAAIQGVVADGALLRALPGLFPAGPGKPGGQEAEGLYAETMRRYTAARKALDSGNLPALVLIVQRSQEGAEAGSFWTDESGYAWSEWAAKLGAGLRGDSSLFPAATRDMRF